MKFGILFVTTAFAQSESSLNGHMSGSGRPESAGASGCNSQDMKTWRSAMQHWQEEQQDWENNFDMWKSLNEETDMKNDDHMKKNDMENDEHMEMEADCPPGSWPQLDVNYTSKGSVISVDGLDIYTVGRGSKCIIWNHDSYGFDSGRSRQFCDLFAAEGYFVIMPDYFRGEQKPPFDATNMAESNAFLTKMTQWEGALKDDLLLRIMPYARKKGAKTFGTIGTCWGSYAVVKMSAWEEIKCGISMHPSHSGLLKLAQEDETEMLKAIKSPQLFMLEGDDFFGFFSRDLTEDILQQEATVIDFPEMKHGWTTRGDMSIPEVDRDVNKAIADALDFFEKNL